MNVSQTKNLILLCLFFISGAVGLAYEIVWARQLSLLIGVSVYAISAVLVAFMAGLGLGAEVFARLLERGVKPVRLYTVLEIGIGAYVLLFPFTLNMLEWVYLSLHTGGQSASFYVILLRFSLAVMALLPPTILMGGTLPALVRYFTSSSEHGSGKYGGGLYGLNTLGAMTGCFLAGFVLIETFGLTNSLRLGAFINIAAGVVAWLVAAEPVWIAEQKESKKKKGSKKKQKIQKDWDVTLLTLYGISGFFALALELLWTRTLILLLNNTTYAFTLILSVFLLGIGTGSAFASRIIKSKQIILIHRFAIFQVGIGIFALLSVLGLAKSDYLIGAFASMIGDSGWLVASFPGGEPMVTAVLFSLFLVTPAALLMGGSFPLAVEAITSGGSRAAMEVGRLYAVNIIGSVLGSVGAGFIMIPYLGVQNSLIIVSWLAIAAGCYLAVTRLKKQRAAFIATALIIALPITGYLATHPDIAFLLSVKKLDLGSEVEYYEEGTSATVLVSSQESDLTVGRRAIKRIWINGDPIAGTFREALQLERLQAHIPLLIHPRAKNALVICFGTGATAGAALVHGLDSVTAVDISREVFNAGPKFKSGNLDVMSSDNLELVEEDGRNYLLTTKAKFDFITAEPPPPSNAGVISLYTREFYQLVIKRLKPGGLTSQWIPLHHLTEEDFKGLVAAFVEVFPKATMWYTKWDAIMIGANDDLPINQQKIQKAMESRAVAASLADLGITNSLQIIDKFMMGPDQLLAYVKGMTPAHDDKPVAEFKSPRIDTRLGARIKGANLAGMLKFRSAPKIVFHDEGANNFPSYFLSQGEFLRGQVDMNDNRHAAAAKRFETALEINPHNSDARYALLSLNLRTLYAALESGRSSLGVQMLDDTQRINIDGLFRPQLKFLRGMFLAREGKAHEAEVSLREAIELDDKYFMAIVNLAILYSTKLQQNKKAIELFKWALELKISNDERQWIVKELEKMES